MGLNNRTSMTSSPSSSFSLSASSSSLLSSSACSRTDTGDQDSPIISVVSCYEEVEVWRIFWRYSQKYESSSSSSSRTFAQCCPHHCPEFQYLANSLISCIFMPKMFVRRCASLQADQPISPFRSHALYRCSLQADQPFQEPCSLSLFSPNCCDI